MEGVRIPGAIAGRGLKKKMKCTHCGHDIPEGKGGCLYCGAIVRSIDQAKHDEKALSENGTDGIADFRKTEGYMIQELARMKGRRRNPLSKAALACIFFLAMLVGGLVVWLCK